MGIPVLVNQLWTETGRRLEDLPGEMMDKDGWRETQCYQLNLIMISNIWRRVEIEEMLFENTQDENTGFKGKKDFVASVRWAQLR